MAQIRSIKVFAEKSLRDELQHRLDQAKSEIESQPDSYILNVNQTDYVNSITVQYFIEPLQLHLEQTTVSTYEKVIDTPLHYPSFSTAATYQEKRNIIRYHIPFSGDLWIMQCQPNRMLVWTTEVQIIEGCICIDILSFSNDSEEIKREYESIKHNLTWMVDSAAEEVEGYNSSLTHKVTTIFENHKQRLLKKASLLASLGVPVKPRSDYPKTFAVPTPATRAKVNVKPQVADQGAFQPHPTLEMSTYQGILQIIHDVGKQLERMPSTYRDKEEEALRDQFLLTLEPRFQGTATGETFNKTGKTDILLRYEETNVFIAECKFWKGQVTYHATITQLLSYLTWRDSKAAVVTFVQNKDFSAVIASVEKETPQHPNYLGFVDKREDTWLNYRFHINGDKNREVKLAVLLFHLPKL